MYRKLITLGIGAVFLAGLTSAQAALKHRYSFDNASGDATGATVTDSVSGANGTVLGANALFTGSALDLPGGSSASAAYMDMPNGMVSDLTALTIEGWVTIDATDQAWARLWDFGTTTEGEHTGPGGGGSGVNYLYLSAAVNLNYNSHRFEMSAGVNNDIFTDAGIPTVVGQQYHFLATVENTEDGGMIGRWWKNGVRIVAGDTADVPLSAIQDVNCWLGRSNWTGDANVNGTFDEFRIYDHAMSALEAQISYQLGPNNTSGDAGAETSRTVEGDDEVVIEGSKRFSLVLTFVNLPEPITFNQDVDLVWSSDNTNVATVSQSGVVAAVGFGTATITGVYAEGTPAAKTITVTDRGLRHQYLFDEASADDFSGNGVATADSIGGAHGTVYYGSVEGNGTAKLDSSNSEYIDLPNGILSQYGAVSVEAWFTPVEDTFSWSRIFSFGTTSLGEVNQDTLGGYTGAGQAFVTIDRGGNAPIYSGDLSWGGNARTINPNFRHGYDALTHVVLTLAPGSDVAALYVNGFQYGTVTAPYVLGDLQDVNAWIGRSQWAGDGFMNGTIEEFRIYEGALTPTEILAHAGAGPTVEAFFADVGTITTLRAETDNTSLVVDAGNALIMAYADFSNLASEVVVNSQEEMIWTSDNTNVVSVSQLGLVTPVGAGTATVTARYGVGGPSDSIQFSVISIVKPTTLVHHWTFDDAPGQTTVLDSVGTAHGTVIGTNHTFTGEAIDFLGGGTSATAGQAGSGSYVDLPNGFVSSLAGPFPGAATFEVAYIRQAAGTWQRVIDFGTSGTEDVPGTGGENIFMTGQAGTGFIRVAVATNTPGYNFEVQWDDIVERPLNTLVHVVFTYDSVDSVSRLYVNGEQVDVDNAVFALANMDDINNWIGRAQYSADPMFTGEIHDLKIYTGIMTAAEVAAAYAAWTPVEVAIESAVLSPEGLVLTWPVDATGFAVETTPSLTAPVTWGPSGVDPVETNGVNQVTIPVSEDEAYFRLTQ